MTEDLAGSWPRLESDESLRLVSALLELSPTDASGSADLTTDGLRFYPTAPRRVTHAQLVRLRDGVLRIASRHGFPDERMRRRTPTFDQELAEQFVELAPMLPVEASDRDVWAFVTLRVLPDVAIWRWPRRAGRPEIVAGELDSGPDLTPVARLLDPRRGVFRQAWWRGYLLGTANAGQLDEDNFVQLTDRVGITGNRRLASAVVTAHLRSLADPSYGRRDGLRAAMKLIGRVLGRIAVDSLSDDQIDELVSRQFDLARGTTAGATTSLGVIDGDGLTVLERFRALASAHIDPFELDFSPIDQIEASRLRMSVRQHARQIASPLARQIADDLGLALDAWSQLTEDERVVVRVAADYFVLEEDANADAGPDGLLDDDEVVRAAFEAMGRVRGVQDWEGR